LFPRFFLELERGDGSKRRRAKFPDRLNASSLHRCGIQPAPSGFVLIGRFDSRVVASPKTLSIFTGTIRGKAPVRTPRACLNGNCRLTSDGTPGACVPMFPVNCDSVICGLMRLESVANVESKRSNRRAHFG